jgi:hypothetical protein
MSQGFSIAAVWNELYANGTVTGAALLFLIVIAIIFATQLEALFSACKHLAAHRDQVAGAQQKIEADAFAALQSVKAIDQSLPELRQSIQELAEEYAKLDAKATEARKLIIREVVLTDVFVQPGDLPYVAKVYRPNAAADEPFAAQWRAGREHVLYGTDKKAAATRFAQRYPTDHGFVVGPVAVFDIPWNPPDEQPALDRA